ncbi:MAG: phosphoenolpyruvate carboxykinase [Spirochaetes bacterium]|nr:phosphoenolpyruvate carboxykinase [Spirochaetota bacterium]
MDISIFKKKIILYTGGRLCDSVDEVLASEVFREIVQDCVEELKRKRSLLLGIFHDPENVDDEDIAVLTETLQYLAKLDASRVVDTVKGASSLLENPSLMNKFVMHLYDYWRGFERYLIMDDDGAGDGSPSYRYFTRQVQQFTDMVRTAYRVIRENITGSHPLVYRQLSAGAKIAAVCRRGEINLPEKYRRVLGEARILRQVLLYPTLIFDPPMNKRAGRFVKIDVNPLEYAEFDPGRWLCFPALVGPMLMHVYFSEPFFDLGFTLCNLFEIARDEDLGRRPDAVYLFGVPGNSLDGLAEYPTVFHYDESNDIFVGACPDRDEYGYFGYLKKMMLTLHNARMIQQGRMPFHGALYQIFIKGGIEATVLMIGDSGAGKSETIEAFRVLGDDMIRDLVIVADDMGSLDISPDGKVLGYGTEIGAFIRLDDITPGFAFRRIDRSIIMSPGKTNTRLVLPVSTIDEINLGHGVEYVFYANNYEEVDEEHPVIERFSSPEEALAVFREGTVMSKGTTASKGIAHSYFANIFGPPQYRREHDAIARTYFDALFNTGAFVGQIRTRLGIPGWEQSGPDAAARELLKLISGG